MNRVRGFEPVKSKFRKENHIVQLPTRSDVASAGYDFYTPNSHVVKAHCKELIWTNVKAYMQPNEVLMIYVRSSIGIKKGLTLSNGTGIIDSSYFNNPSNDGNIGICLFNNTDEDVLIDQGERIAQGVFLPYLTVDEDTCINTERTGGIGSSGK